MDFETIIFPHDRRITGSTIREVFHPIWQMPTLPRQLRVAIPPDVAAMHTDTLCVLAVQLLRAWDGGVDIQFTGNLDPKNRVVNYLARANLFGLIGRHPRGLPLPELYTIGRHFPLRIVPDLDAVTRTVNHLVDVLLSQARCSKTVVQGFEWAINEIIDNVLVHSGHKLGAVVMGQTTDPPSPSIRVAVGDLGAGISATLRPAYPEIRRTADLIKHATQAGVTRNPSIGQGNGLAGSLQIAMAAQGSLLISSEDQTVDFRPGSVRITSEYPSRGSLVVLTLNTSSPIDLHATLVGEPSYSYLESMFENETGDRLLTVKDHASNFGNRVVGKQLRTMLSNISDDAREGVTIDFSGVRSISSSFADEFIGKFALEHGIEQFSRLFRIIGTNELQASIVQKALHTRAGAESKAR